MGQLTPEALELIKKNNTLFFEITEAWKRNRGSIYRWILENRRPELCHPTTIKLIEKYNTENIKIVQE